MVYRYRRARMSAVPLVTDKYVLLLSHGLLACFDRAKGEESGGAEEPREPLWEEDLVEEVSSSPSLVGEFIYLFAEEGKVWILKPDGGQVRANCGIGDGGTVPQQSGLSARDGSTCEEKSTCSALASKQGAVGGRCPPASARRDCGAEIKPGGRCLTIVKS